MLACYLQDLQQELLDRLLTSFSDLLVGIFRRTEHKEQTHHITHGKTLTQHVHTLRKVAKVVLDTSVPDEQVRPQIFAVVPQTQLQEVYKDSGAKARPEDGQTFDLLLKHYTFLHQFLPDLLVALEFTGTSAAKPVVQSIAALKRMDAEGKRTLPSNVPLNFLPGDWRTAVEAACASKDPKGRRRAKRLWELGLAEQMRKLLRSSDLSVPGSRQHKVWTSYLHTETAWTERKSSWFARHPAHQDANTYLDALEERYQTTLRNVLDGWDTNDFAQIVIKGGKAILDLSKDEKPVLPATVEPLRTAMLALMPHARLADVFLEVEDWTGFREDFPHLNERQQPAKRDPRTDLALFAAILAHGLNLP